MTCELCDLVTNRNIITRHYYTDKTITIVDCKSCITKLELGEIIPLVVFRHHGEATDLERRLAMVIVDYLFEYKSIRKEPRQIMDHEHWHVIGAKYLGGVK